MYVYTNLRYRERELRIKIDPAFSLYQRIPIPYIVYMHLTRYKIIFHGIN
jgi:hypothetical protein